MNFKMATKECLEKMIEVLGEETVKDYQKASKDFDFEKNERCAPKNPTGMSDLQYTMAVTQCITKLFIELNVFECTNQGLEIGTNQEELELIVFFQEVVKFEYTEEHKEASEKTKKQYKELMEK